MSGSGASWSNCGISRYRFSVTQLLDNGQLMIGRKMRVTASHLNSLMSKCRLKGAKTHTFHRQSTRKGVPEAMPSEVRDLGFFHCRLKPVS